MKRAALVGVLLVAALAPASAPASPPINPVPGNGNAYGHPRMEVSCTPGPVPWCVLREAWGR